MSEPSNCSKCGKAYGTSFGDVNGLCSRCAVNPNWEKDLYAKNEVLQVENEELRAEIKRLIKEIAILKNEPVPDGNFQI